MNFASDNGAGVAPDILEAIAASSRVNAPAYGADDYSQRATAMLSEVFETKVEAFLVATGTAANALALSALARPWEAVFCHEEAHIHDDECSAPEFFTGGAKLSGSPGEGGKLTPEALAETLERFPRGLVKSAQPGALSLSQATEAGTIYGVDEIAALSRTARAAGVRRAHGRRALRQCARRPRRLARRHDLARGDRRAVVRRDQERRARLRGGRLFRSRRWRRTSPIRASAAATRCRKGASSARRWRPI